MIFGYGPKLGPAPGASSSPLKNVGHVSNVPVFAETWHDGIVPHVFVDGLLGGKQSVEVDRLRAGHLRRSRCPDLLIARHNRSPNATLRAIPTTPGSEICCKNEILPISQMLAKSGGTS